MPKAQDLRTHLALCHAQSCPTLCNPMNCSPPGSSVHGILQARILEWRWPFSSPEYPPNPGIEPESPASPTLQTDSLSAETSEKPEDLILEQGFPHSSVGKESACNAGDPGLIPGLGRSPGEGNGNTLQYSCLENSMDGGAWSATVHGVSRVRHNWLTFTHSF